MVCVALVSVCQALELDPVAAKNESVEALVSKKCIYLEAGGSADLSMDMACGLLGRPDMLEMIQQAYQDMMPEGKSVEFTVKKEGEGKYSYVNRHNEQTRIEEVARTVIPDQKVVVALYSEGRRFFGAYQSLVQVEVNPADEGGVQYNVCVYAYPESRMFRLFAKLPPVEHFFRSKTVEMTELTLSICRKIYEEENASASAAQVAGL